VFGDCNGLTVDGCEATLGSDTANCGSCGHVCPAGDTCVAGKCVAPCGVKVNEVSPATSLGNDGFVELYNNCPTNITLSAAVLVARDVNNNGGAGVADNVIYGGINATMNPGAFLLLCQQNFAMVCNYTINGVIPPRGGIGVRPGVGQALLDSVAYGTVVPNNFVETMPAMAPGAGSAKLSSIGRDANGDDTNDNSVDFTVQLVATPGAANR
jgi:hypothetical protein